MNKLTLTPMPEIDFIDPITGKLPKNIQGRNSARRDPAAKSVVNTNSAVKKQNEQFEVKLRPMPEISLIDPITGKLPKNYKQMLSETKGDLPKTSHSNNILLSNKDSKQRNKEGESNRRRSKNIFDISPLEINDNLSRTGQTYNRKRRSVRKVLFSNSTTAVNVKRTSRLPTTLKRSQSAASDESVLLDIEESERRLLQPKKRPKNSFRGFPKPHTTVLKMPKNKKKHSLASSPSLEEFVKLEQQLKTPKTHTILKKGNDTNILECLDNIIIKLDESKNLYEKLANKIETNNIEINNNLTRILKYLQEDREDVTAVKTDKYPHSEEDIKKENISPNTESMVNSLRISTLRKNFGKTVSFENDAKENSIDSPAGTMSNVMLKTAGNQTPKTMLRSVSKRANEQLLKLQDTPKSTTNPIRNCY